MKSTTLPASHYASSWKTEGVVQPLEVVNELGRRFAELPAELEEKQDLLLEICRCFHPYLMKYLVMICRPPGVQGYGHVGNLRNNWFKQVNGYDPNYKDKVKRVVEVIDNELSKRRQFTGADIDRYLDIDSRRYIRLLCRIGFLQATKDNGAGKATAYIRTETWPLPAEFFKGVAIGVAYYLQKWFRFNLQEWGVAPAGLTRFGRTWTSATNLRLMAPDRCVLKAGLKLFGPVEPQ